MAKEEEAFEELTDEKRAQLSRNRVVTTQIARVTSDKTKKTSTPHKYTVRQLENRINKYFNWCEGADRVPSITGMMVSLKMSRDSFYKMMENEKYRHPLEKARTAMVEWVANDIYRTPGQAAGKIAYAKNIHGWAEKVDTTSVNENRNTTVLSVDDARAKIASLAHLINPELFEAVASNFVKKQLVHIEEAEVSDG